MLITFFRHALFLMLFLQPALGTAAEATSAAAQPATPAPSCTHCRARLQSVEALRKALPGAWTIRLEREPVFDSEILTVQAGSDAAPPLLLVHGLGNNGFTDWLSVLPRLARQYHVIALDLPGFGYSATPRGKYSTRNYARVLNWLLARYSQDKKAIVVGHSLGGAVALRFASDFPAQLDKLVLVDAAGILQRTAFVKHGARVERGGDVPFLQGALGEINGVIGDTIERVFALPDLTTVLNVHDLVWASMLGNAPQVNAAMALVEDDFSRTVSTLSIPTWLIWGAADPIAPLRTGLALANRLPQAQLLVMPNVGHTPMDASSAPAFLQLLERALQQAPQPTLPDTQASSDAPDLQCKNETTRFITGQFREIVIDGCSGVQMEHVTAEHIVVRNSTLRMTDVQVDASTRGGAALEVTGSEVIVTAGKLVGDIALRVDAARVDLAGLTLSGRDRAVDVLRTSYLISSLCELRSAANARAWQESSVFSYTALNP